MAPSITLVSSTWSYSEKSFEGSQSTPSAFCRAHVAVLRPCAASSNSAGEIVPAQNFSSANFSSRRGPMRGNPRLATETIIFIYPDEDGGDRSGARAGRATVDPGARHASDQTGHPAGGRYGVGGRSPGSRVKAKRSVFPEGEPSSDMSGPPLAAYSCGGSAGIAPLSGRAPASRLSSGAANRPENLDKHPIGFPSHHVNRAYKEFFICSIDRRSSEFSMPVRKAERRFRLARYWTAVLSAGPVPRRGQGRDRSSPTPPAPLRQRQRRFD